MPMGQREPILYLEDDWESRVHFTGIKFIPRTDEGIYVDGKHHEIKKINHYFSLTNGMSEHRIVILVKGLLE